MCRVHVIWSFTTLLVPRDEVHQFAFWASERAVFCRFTIIIELDIVVVRPYQYTRRYALQLFFHMEIAWDVLASHIVLLFLDLS